MSQPDSRKTLGLEHCDICRADTTRTVAGDCTVCLAREARRQKRERREAAEAADRERLGLQPSSRGPALVRISVDAALHWCRVATRAGVELPVGVAHHLERARQELER